MIFPFIPKATLQASQVCTIRCRLNLILCLYYLKKYLTFTCCAIKSYKNFHDTQKAKKKISVLKNILFHVRRSHKKVSRQFIFIEEEKIFFCYFRVFLYILFFMLLLAVPFTAKNYCLNLPRITYTRVRYYNHYYDVYVCRSLSLSLSWYYIAH